MRQKNKLKKKITSSPPITPEQEGFLGSLLKNLNNINSGNIKDYIDTPESALMVVEHLPGFDAEVVKLLLTIKETFGQKEIQKAVRKAVFKLKRKGISIPNPKTKKKTSLSFRRLEDSEPKAYLSPIDGTGNRGLLIMVPLIPKGVEVGIGIVNTEEGITYFTYERYSKKRSKEVKGFFFKKAGSAIETSMSHAATILEKAYKKNEINAGKSSGDYLRLRPWLLENISLLNRPAIYDFIQPEDISDGVLNDSRIDKLLGHKLMSSWLISPSKIWPVLDEIAKAEISPIILSEEQKIARINEIKERAIQEFYPDSKRLILQDELEEMAYLFFKLDEEEYAHLCLAGASTLKEKDSIIMINPFLKIFLEHSLDHYYKLMRETGDPEARENDYSPSIITT